MGERPAGATSGVRSVLGCEDWGVPVTAELPPGARDQCAYKGKGVLEWPPGQRNATGRAIQAGTGDPTSGQRRRSTSHPATRDPLTRRCPRLQEAFRGRVSRTAAEGCVAPSQVPPAAGARHSPRRRRGPSGSIFPPKIPEIYLFPPLACFQDSLRLKLSCRLEATARRPSRRQRCGTSALAPVLRNARGVLRCSVRLWMAGAQMVS